MAYICYKPAGSCKTCSHYRWDEDRQRMACWAKFDEENNNEKKRIKMQLPNSKYFVVAEINETMPNHQEIDVMIEDKDGVVIQDVVRVESTVSKMDMDNTEHDQDVLTLYLYEDEYDEDYTKKTHIRVYKDGEETTNM